MTAWKWNQLKVARRMWRGGTALAAGLIWAGTLTAQTPPATGPDGLLGNTKDAKVTTGTTDVAVTGKAVGFDREAKDGKDATELSISAGSLLSTGNSRTFAGTTNGKFRLRRQENQLSAALAGNYGRSAPPKGSLTTNVQNVQGSTRYDRFFGNIGLFFAAQGRNDKFQGLDLRAQLDPGVGYYFLQQKAQLLWIEVGYDLLYDIRRNDSRGLLDTNGTAVTDGAGNPVLLNKTKAVHSARLFTGYEYAIDTGFKLSVGVEFLQGLSDPSIYRINGIGSANAKIQGNLSMSVAFTERYDAKPLPDKEKLDTITTFSLVYTLF